MNFRQAHSFRTSSAGDARGRRLVLRGGTNARSSDIVGVISACVKEEARRRKQNRKGREIPMRPDHGHLLAENIGQEVTPGYSLVGRLKGLAELRGVVGRLRSMPCTRVSRVSLHRRSAETDAVRCDPPPKGPGSQKEFEEPGRDRYRHDEGSVRRSQSASPPADAGW